MIMSPLFCARGMANFKFNKRSDPVRHWYVSSHNNNRPPDLFMLFFKVYGSNCILVFPYGVEANIVIVA
jgi:hypothetical protein